MTEKLKASPQDREEINYQIMASDICVPVLKKNNSIILTPICRVSNYFKQILRQQFNQNHDFPVVFSKDDLPTLREFYRIIKNRKDDFSTTTKTIINPFSPKLVYCGIDYTQYLDWVEVIGKNLHDYEKVYIH